MDGQVTGVKPAMFPLTSISNQASLSLHQDPLGGSSFLGLPQRGSLTPNNNMGSLCDELSKHEYEDIVGVDYFFDTVNFKGRLKDHIQFWVNIQVPDLLTNFYAATHNMIHAATHNMIHLDPSVAPIARVWARRTRISVMSSQSFVSKKCRTSTFQKSFFITTTRIWNLLITRLDLDNVKGGKFLKKLWCCVGGSITR